MRPHLTSSTRLRQVRVFPKPGCTSMGTPQTRFPTGSILGPPTTQTFRVHSLSVGEPEDEFASDNGGQSAVDRMNNEMAAIGARGVGIIFASGDSGYQVAQKYPSSSPYVTSVGGVFNGELGDDVLQVDDETTGGFSSLEVNPIGKWQMKAVAAWEKTKGSVPSTTPHAVLALTYPSMIPDSTLYDGSDQPIGGTSAAAPTLAGMISSINGHLLDAGKPTLGFLNYFLYQHEDAFLDIVHGGNNGFDATVGYDPASGLGTFSPTTFATLKAAALGNSIAVVQRFARRMMPRHERHEWQDGTTGCPDLACWASSQRGCSPALRRHVLECS